MLSRSPIGATVIRPEIDLKYGDGAPLVSTMADLLYRTYRTLVKCNNWGMQRHNVHVMVPLPREPPLHPHTKVQGRLYLYFLFSASIRAASSLLSLAPWLRASARAFRRALNASTSFSSSAILRGASGV